MTGGHTMYPPIERLLLLDGTEATLFRKFAFKVTRFPSHFSSRKKNIVERSRIIMSF